MLCDQALAVTLNDIGKGWPTRTEAFHRWVLNTFEMIWPTLRTAQKFILEDDVALTCTAISQNRPSSVMAAMKFAVLPFKVVWIEWTGLAGYEVIANPEPDMIVVRRVGLLIEADSDLRSGIARLFWSLPPPYDIVRISPHGAQFDFTDGVFSKFGRPTPRSNTESTRKHFPHWFTNAADLAALEQMDRQVLPLSIRETIGEAGQSDFTAWDLEAAQRISRASDISWQNKIPLLRAFLIMMNCHNGTETFDADVARQNRARQRSGRLPLFEHKVIRLKLRGPERHALAASKGEQTTPLRAHLVRGHFKVRKTGVFFWSPFVRGDAKAGVIDHRYEVQP